MYLYIGRDKLAPVTAPLNLGSELSQQIAVMLDPQDIVVVDEHEISDKPAWLVGTPTLAVTQPEQTVLQGTAVLLQLIHQARQRVEVLEQQVRGQSQDNRGSLDTDFYIEPIEHDASISEETDTKITERMVQQYADQRAMQDKRLGKQSHTHTESSSN